MPLTNGVVMQAFVARADVGAYQLKDIWQQPSVRREVVSTFLEDPLIRHSLCASRLAVRAQDLQSAVLLAIGALVTNLKVCMKEKPPGMHEGTTSRHA